MDEERQDGCTPIPVLICGDANRRVRAKRFKLCNTPEYCCWACPNREGCNVKCLKETLVGMVAE
jgi:hypothetical protein